MSANQLVPDHHADYGGKVKYRAKDKIKCGTEQRIRDKISSTLVCLLCLVICLIHCVFFLVTLKNNVTNKAIVVAGILLEKIDESGTRVTRHVNEFVHSTALPDGMKN